MDESGDLFRRYRTNGNEDALQRLREFFLQLFSPSPQTVSAAQNPGMADGPILNEMDRRRLYLQNAGQEHTGGMFDIIYQKRKEREDALRALGLQD